MLSILSSVDASGQMRKINVNLTGWYASEGGGEALFAQLARRGEPARARKWTSLAQVEAQVKAGVAARLELAELELAGQGAASLRPIEAFLDAA